MRILYYRGASGGGGYASGYGGGGAFASGGGGGGGGGSKTCYTCGGVGHLSRDCVQGSKCYNCGGVVRFSFDRGYLANPNVRSNTLPASFFDSAPSPIPPPSPFFFRSESSRSSSPVTAYQPPLSPPPLPRRPSPTRRLLRRPCSATRSRSRTRTPPPRARPLLYLGRRRPARRPRRLWSPPRSPQRSPNASYTALDTALQAASNSNSNSSPGKLTVPQLVPFPRARSPSSPRSPQPAQRPPGPARTASTPVILLSNGKPLKSSLKSSSSAPHSLHHHHLRAPSTPSLTSPVAGSSASSPTTPGGEAAANPWDVLDGESEGAMSPGTPKAVHFPAPDSLEDVRVFRRSARPASVSFPLEEETETETETDRDVAVFGVALVAGEYPAVCSHSPAASHFGNRGGRVPGPRASATHGLAIPPSTRRTSSPCSPPASPSPPLSPRPDATPRTSDAKAATEDGRARSSSSAALVASPVFRVRTAVDDAIRRREEEELQRVLEMSVRDRGGRQAYGAGAGAYEAGAGAYGNNAASGGSSSGAGGGEAYGGSGAGGGGGVGAGVGGYAPAAAGHGHGHGYGQERERERTPSPASPTTPANANANGGGGGAGAFAEGAIITRVRALHPFTPTEAGELGFEKGDVIKVVDRGYRDWWRSQLRGRTGIFPVNYVVRIPRATSMVADNANAAATAFALPKQHRKRNPAALLTSSAPFRTLFVALALTSLALQATRTPNIMDRPSKRPRTRPTWPLRSAFADLKLGFTTKTNISSLPLVALTSNALTSDTLSSTPLKDPSLKSVEGIKAAAMEVKDVHGIQLAEGSTEVYDDVWTLLSENYIDTRTMERQDLMNLQYICRNWLHQYRPLIYERINLRTYKDAEILFRLTLPNNKHLLPHIKLLSFGFPLPQDDTADMPLWTAFRTELHDMINLAIIIVSFTHKDPEPLGQANRLLLHGLELPKTLDLLHLRSSAEFFEDEIQLGDYRPWEGETWRLDLALIPAPIKQFVLSTPHYVIWPPTDNQIDLTLNKWTAQWRKGYLPAVRPTLDLITINQGYIDDGSDMGRCAEYSDFIFKHDLRHSHEALENALSEDMGNSCDMEGREGFRLMWEQNKDGKWERTDLAWVFAPGAYQAFGGLNDECDLAWIHTRPWLVIDGLNAPHRDHPDFV
ncbi:hypothetical protein C8F04DRAFT_1272456 [Mycena alexandri]|uniref:SH3 domain-containing protein n=1 Tax=Mycena alexandri TaxID=1745969 RepID=A0AAD6WT85_9AGAR|nr:hypothetical protein C8F04DRAFT_1272456 [Mycena alexandri]